MNKLTKTLVGFVLLTLLFVFSCQQKNNKVEDTIIEGKATFYVDESILPIVEDEVAVFETEYNAKLHLVRDCMRCNRTMRLALTVACEGYTLPRHAAAL